MTVHILDFKVLRRSGFSGQSWYKGYWFC